MKDPPCVEAGVVVPPLVYQMMIDNKIVENRVRELELKSAIDEKFISFTDIIPYLKCPFLLPPPCKYEPEITSRAPMHPKPHVPGYGWHMAAGPAQGPLLGDPYH